MCLLAGGLPGRGAAVAGSEVPALPAVLSGPAEAVPARQPVIVWVGFLNGSTTNAPATFPAVLAARLLAEGRFYETNLLIRPPSAPGQATLGPGEFARREYALRLPDPIVGTVLLSVPALRTTPIAIEVRPADRLDPVAREDLDQPSLAGLQEEEPLPRRSPFRPGRFFREHFFGYEPFYFIAGPEMPNAKFQISLRYQLFNNQGLAAQRVPAFKGLNLAYTQTSLWDWSAPSAPFFDSSYKPELLYLWQRVDRGRWAPWFRLDLQAGYQHESNGKGGADSRSLNILYLWPQAVLGHPDGFQFKLAPRVWAYMGELTDNPDLEQYRGYGDLRATLGWQRSLQLAATGRLGEGARRGSVQLDLTFPMMQLLSESLTVYLHAQYFNGYGESLLLYNDRSSAWRLGFSLFR